MKNTHYKKYFLISLASSCMLLGQALSLNAYERTTTTTVTTTKTVGDTDASVKPSTPEHQYLTFDLNMNNIYQNNQRVDGQIVVRNAYSEPLDAKFHVLLFHQDKLEKEYETSISEILPGENVFTLDRFGIPQINTSKRDQGDWTIVVYPSDLGPDYSKEAKFRVLSSV